MLPSYKKKYHSCWEYKCCGSILFLQQSLSSFVTISSSIVHGNKTEQMSSVVGSKGTTKDLKRKFTLLLLFSS